MILKHMKYFNGFVNESISEENEDEFKAPQLTGSVKTIKSISKYKSQKKKEIYGTLELNHNGTNVLSKSKLNVKFTYDSKSDKYVSNIKIKTKDYSGEVLVYVDWGFGKQELEYGMPQIGKNIQWVSIKSSSKSIVSKRDSEDDEIVVTNLNADNYFDLNKATIKREGIIELNKFAQKMKGSTVKIDGYASIEGNANDNLKLSQNRAQSVSNFLKKKGIDVKSSKGYGGSEKFGKGEENYSKNRRVVITTL